MPLVSHASRQESAVAQDIQDVIHYTGREHLLGVDIPRNFYFFFGTSDCIMHRRIFVSIL
ncbi:hypothetical protein PAXRUDRAFT_834101 [Paxillus rubicundulus Ve08.2h10]|uniref:Unplaced genomic scaffold scaffold_1461, whole genome shotgun sequence n=1 Tax=Paxillus rubicundulus Ve08.2h10 TaxID=930991 RepID=A0A0D0CVH7_9AGAM|nr:hypothetical protein PAXRUDRAFT_834101 [Paxillus rubicundulus Ve08.2h10]